MTKTLLILAWLANAPPTIIPFDSYDACVLMARKISADGAIVRLTGIKCVSPGHQQFIIDPP